MSSVRAFLAAPIPPQVKAAIGQLQKRLGTQSPDIRWTKPDNLHLTMHFFGDVSEETLEKIRVSMLSVKGCQRPFQVDIKGLGAFPSLQRPRVVWLGLAPTTRLRQLHHDIQQSLQDVGITPETRAYSPHLTIGRVRKEAVDLSEQSVTLSDTTMGHLLIDRMVLYESRLRPGGARHIPLSEVTLDD